MRPYTARRAAKAATAAMVLVSLATASALSQSAQPVEAWRRSIPNHVGVMMDLDSQDNVFALGYGTAVITRKYAPNGALQWERPLPGRALPT